MQRNLNRVAAALCGVTFARLVNQNSSHQTRRDPEEVRAILPMNLRLIHQTEIRLVNQRGRL